MTSDIAPRRQHRPIDQVGVDAMLSRMASGRMLPPAVPEVALSTGFDPLDKALEGGLRLGDLTIVGGGPGVGKTVATLQWARTFAVRGFRVLYHCYEHDVPTLFGRLLALECGALRGVRHGYDAEEVPNAVGAVMQGDWDPAAPYANSAVVRAALAQMTGYAELLTLSQAASASADLALLEATVAEASPAYDVVVVDYLQKVPVPDLFGNDRFAAVVEGLKNLALSEHCQVIAVSAVNEGALEERRLHLEGLRGAHVLAHEADVVITLNRKLKIVAKAHLAFDTTLEQKFARTVVFTIEKNRRGLAPLDLEFDTEFSSYRFDPHGRFVAERLVGGFTVDE
jgi:replicative DNA helicase